MCSEVLQWEPGGFRAEATHRHKYACRPCQSGVVLGPAPVRVLEQAMPGAGLLAEVVVRKIKDHCPLERQSRILLLSALALRHAILKMRFAIEDRLARL